MSNFNKKLFSKPAALIFLSVILLMSVAAVVPYIRPMDKAEASPAMPQIFEPVKWSYSTEKGKLGEIVLVFTAKIDKGWHLYSQDIPDGGPIATSFTFNENPNIELVGKVTEPKPIEEEDKNFMMTLKYFEQEAKFKQRIKVKGKTTIEGELEFMVCDDERCLPPDYREFKFEVEPIVAPANEEKGDAEENKKVKEEEETTAAAPDIGKEKENIEEGDQTLPETNEENTETGSDVSASSNTSEIVAADDEEESEDISFWFIFIKGFLGGLVALLTPCVFPMIPLTVSFFTKRSKTKAKGITNALTYSFFIIFMYTGLGMAITLILGPDALYEMSSGAFFNALFFIVLLVFGMSFLGAFEITLPSSWVNKADQASDKGGLIGIFFMAFTLALVSFSCTGPIVGTLLVDAAVGGNVAGPAIGMFGFSLALALPFGLFAAFPGWMNSLPKSGGWLNSVKVTLGILEIAFSLKFLSNIDLAYHWGILTREVFIALWIVLFATLGFYLLGKLRFSHDSKTEHISVPRYMLAVVVLAFVAYLIPGMWGAPLKMISGFPPPSFYTEWPTETRLEATSNSTTTAEVIDGVDRAHCPHNLSCFHDYDKAIAYAREIGKPLMVDFTGWSCVNCRKMENNVWVDPRVLERISNEYVLVSLYVDDRTKLPENERRVSDVTGKKIRTIGNKWAEFQTRNFKTISQPYYVLLDHEEQVLTKPRAYDLDIDAYVSWLDKGLQEFKKRETKEELSSL